MKYRGEDHRFLTLFLLDCGVVVFGVGPGLIAWISGLLYLRRVWPMHPMWWLLTPLVVIAAYLATIFVLRRFIPRLQTGVFDVGPNLRFTAWVLNMYLSHSLHISGLRPAILSTYMTRYAFWRIMGADVDLCIHSSLFVNVVDLPLIKIRKGASLGANTHIAGHLFRGDKILLGNVEIDEGSAIGMGCTIGPRSRLGKQVFLGMNCEVGLDTVIHDDAWIGTGNRIVGQQVGQGEVVGHFEWEYGHPNAPIRRLPDD